MPQTQDQLATEEDVYAFIDHVPADLVECRRKHHEWEIQAVDGYTTRRNLTKNYAKAVVLDVTEVCLNCGAFRYHTRDLRKHTTSGFTYSNFHEALRAPRGIQKTGISVRYELEDRYWTDWAQNGGRASAPRSSKRRHVKAA